jgi:hypothetical protein
MWHVADAPAGKAERYLPAGTLGLAVNLGDGELTIENGQGVQRHAWATVAGAYHSCFGVQTEASTSVVAVTFLPGQAGPLLGVPPGELADLHVELSALWGRRAAELRERLCASTTCCSASGCRHRPPHRSSAPDPDGPGPAWLRCCR